MKPAVVVSLTGLALTGCSDLSRPNTFRVSRDRTGTESQVDVAPPNVVRLKDHDGKYVYVPRVHPPGTPSAGKPVLPGETPQVPPRPAPAPH